jgi:dTDP-4-dehydrorhamnose 3,5-epimerase-like enzyme
MTFLDRIDTSDKDGKPNGSVYPMVNTLIPEQLGVELVYSTTCLPGSVKGPHVHFPPKHDRFVCVEGSCVVVTRNEQTLQISEWILGKRMQSILLIPPYNSHAIVSSEGCTVLSICNQGFYPGHYNQMDTEYEGYDWDQWLIEEKN